MAKFLSVPRYNQAHPLPNLVLAAVLNASLNLSTEPNDFVIAADRSAEGLEDPIPRFFQKNKWL